MTCWWSACPQPAPHAAIQCYCMGLVRVWRAPEKWGQIIYKCRKIGTVVVHLEGGVYILFVIVYFVSKSWNPMCHKLCGCGPQHLVRPFARAAFRSGPWAHSSHDLERWIIIQPEFGREWPQHPQEEWQHSYPTPKQTVLTSSYALM